MSNINQLLAKAMSTTSEEEAMSCLRMARKKGKTFDAETTSTSTSTYNGQGPKYWYDKAAYYYNEAKKREGDLTRDQQAQLFRMYRNAEDDKVAIKNDNYKLRKEIAELRTKKSDAGWKIAVICFQAFIIMGLVALNH
jgi:hypothetical protein